MSENITPAATGVDHQAAEHTSPRGRLARIGVAGLLDPSSRVERLQERRDRDRAHWIGHPVFDRPATPAERALISSVAGVDGARGVMTRVDVRGGLYRRRWPGLVHPARAS